MKDLYLIDGYNVIFWLPEEFPRTDLESSRKKLVDLMQDYGAHNDVEVIVVFDGKSRSLKAKVETVSPFFHVVYTPSKMTADSYIETADSYIEMESYKRRDEYRSIFVVTSDGAEQNQVLGNGAYRMAVSDLVRLWNEDKKVQTIFIRRNNMANPRSEIGRHIPSSVQDKLERLRRK